MKLLFLLIISFSLGFALHWFITRTQVQPVSILGQNVLGQASQNEFITYVDYDGKEFKPGSVTIKKGNYLAITNKSSDKQMWLVSDNADLNTKRGFGEGERLKIILLGMGNYKVTNKLDSRSLLSITVE